MAKIKIHNINIEEVARGTGAANGEVKMSLNVYGLNNVEKIMAAFNAAKGLQEAEKNFSLINIVAIIYDIYNILRKGA